MLDQPWVLISIGGVLGANARYLVGVWAARRIGTSFPYGTLIANVSGSIMLGFLTIFAARLAAVGPELRLAAGVGFCGAYTTFSTFAFESVTLTRHGNYARALVNVGVTTLLGIGGALLGMVAASLI